MTLRELQDRIRQTYGARDAARGKAGTFLWFVEEVGELAEGIRTGSRAVIEEECADVVAWLVSVATLEGVDVEEAVTRKYARGCPKCGESPCTCVDPTAPSA
jgi:NTP pyrophosphatase (non-canonical NTP hydrolase)